MRRAAHAGERGRGTLRLLALLLLLAVAAGTVLVYLRVTTQPDLGAAPQGPAHGDSELALAAWAATSLAPLAVPGGPGHESVTLSEQDLTVEARARQAMQGGLRDPEVRVRAGELLVSGHTTVLGVDVLAVGHLGAVLTTGGDGLPDVGVVIHEVDAGDLTLPGLLRDAVERRVQSHVRLSGLLSSTPALSLLRRQLDCVLVTDSGVRLGFHGLFAAADPQACQS